MLAELPASIFHKWHSHYLAEPWGYEFEMYRHSEVCMYLVNGLFNPKNPVKSADFYPKESTDDDDKEMSEAEMIQALKGIS